MTDVAKVEVLESTALQAQMTAEIDSQVATAKRFPRDVRSALKSAEQLVALNKETAADCIYKVPRDGTNIEGASSRFAEILACTWGNLRVSSRVIQESAKEIVCQGVCHDLETNTAYSVEVTQRITKRDGRRYADDMVITAKNAASSKASRNATLKAVPKALWQPIFDKALKVAGVSRGGDAPIEDRRRQALRYFEEQGVTREQLLKKLGKVLLKDVTDDDLRTLRGFANTIDEGDATAAEIFATTPPEADVNQDSDPFSSGM